MDPGTSALAEPQEHVIGASTAADPGDWLGSLTRYPGAAVQLQTEKECVMPRHG